MDRERTRLVINEIFLSIQGESSHAGRPCAFVRLTGCNLRCNYCDTEYAFYEGRKMTIEEILAQLDTYGCNLVEITGGEPLLQDGVYHLIAELLAAGRTVMIETSGASDVSRLNPRVIKVMDLKCPGSGEAARNLWSNLEHLTARDEVKFVLSDRADYEWARDVIREHNLASRVNAVLMSCAFDRLARADLAQWILEDRLPVRFQLQMHKHIWPPDTRGV
ncbi:MAG TPA: radical SAM protein [Candidatus Binataceae bacterium]|nr:radical SAM protein [Candidatus Binataceae bacterium]